MKNTMTFLLAGGEGKRLGAMTYWKPKPLVPFAGKYRLIDFPLSNAVNSGVKWLGLLVQASQKSIIDYVNNGDAWGFRNHQAELRSLPSYPSQGKGIYRGTADAVRQNLALFEKKSDYDTILILSSDHVYQMNYSEIIDFHRRHQADVTVAVTEVAPQETHKFGIVTQDNQHKIINWQEKPSRARSTLASMGIYVFSKTFLLQAFEKCQGDDFGHHIIPYACKHARIFGYKFSGYWRDVGTPDAYWQANMDLLNPDKNFKLETWKIKSNLLVHDEKIEKKSIAKAADIKNNIIANSSMVKGQAINSIIFPGVQAHEHAFIRNSIIMTNCTIAPNTRIENSILCDRASIGKGAIIGCTKSMLKRLEPGDLREYGLVVIGEKINIKPGECIHKNSMLYTQKQYEKHRLSYRLSNRPLAKNEMPRTLLA